MFVDEKKHGEATPDLGTLRVDRILMLADEIEKPTRGLGFDMDLWESKASCGTVCCIGWHAEVMFRGDDVSTGSRFRAGLAVKRSRHLPP